MLEIRELFSASKDERSLCRLIISPKMKVRTHNTLAWTWNRADSRAGEKARISAAGGFVDFGRVNGNLALSRAIGDFEFKKSADLSPEQQIVTAFPDVITHEISPDDEFLVIACDGRTSVLARQGSWNADFECRHMGLPVVTSSHRVRAKRRCRKARATIDL